MVGSRSLRTMRMTAGHIEDKIGRLHELQRIADGQTASPTALAAFDALSIQQPADLSALCEKLSEGVPFDFSEEVPVAAGSAWLLRRAEISFERVSLSRLAEIIGRAESERPPWRAHECLIEADPTEPGYGRVTIGFEALHKEEI